MALEFETVVYDVTDGVATVRLHRPDEGNRLDATLREELLHALMNASEDEAVRVVVLRGDGESFCAGIDEREHAEQMKEAKGFERGRSLQDEGRRLIRLLREMGKPVVAFVDGVASGAGAALALACDIRLVTADACFEFDFASTGGFPDWGSTYFLPKLVGSGHALDLLWSGRSVDGASAVSMNLAQQCLDDDVALDAYCRRLATLPRAAARLTAMAIHASADYDLPSMLDFESEAAQQCWAATEEGSK